MVHLPPALAPIAVLDPLPVAEPDIEPMEVVQPGPPKPAAEPMDAQPAAVQGQPQPFVVQPAAELEPIDQRAIRILELSADLSPVVREQLIRRL